MDLLLLLSMAYLRLLLLPFSVLYGFAVWVRNRCYDWGWFRSRSFNHPVIVVGNLAVGGTGKSPMTEYLLRLLHEHYTVATLSRGYGRKTRGFFEVSPLDTAADCGDEPLQFKRKFPHVTVTVGEDRVNGVRRLIQSGKEVVVLDDAFQHRALKPGLAILLFDYQRMKRPKWLLPAGDYRDWFSERRRADVMIVTKMPGTATEQDKADIRRMLRSKHRDIPVLFSKIGYGAIVPLFPGEEREGITLTAQVSVLLVTGIANPAPLRGYLATRAGDVVQLSYPDHHQYTKADIRNMINRFEAIANPHKLIITTEKDAQRLLMPELSGALVTLPVYVVPIHPLFDGKEEEFFRQLVLTYCARVLGS